MMVGRFSPFSRFSYHRRSSSFTTVKLPVNALETVNPARVVATGEEAIVLDLPKR